MPLRHVNYTLRPAELNAAKPQGKAYVLTDGGGLYLEVLPGGSKVWRYTFRFGARRPKITIGPYPQIGISAARDEHEKLRAMVAKGEDPTAVKKAAAVDQARTEMPTFQAFAQMWVKKTMGHVSASYRAQTTQMLDRDINPIIGHLPMDQVKPRQVLAVLETKQETPPTAEVCRGIIQRVFNHAIRNLLVESNPAIAVRGAVVRAPKKHHRHLNERELAGFWQALRRQRSATVIVTYCAMLLQLTMVRKSELRLAKWEEFDLEAGIWDIPEERMKMRRPHRVWLSRQAIEILRQLQHVTGEGDYAFPTRFVGGNGLPISETTLNHMFGRLDFGVPDFSPHGTRGTAATLLRENGFEKDVVELLLAHVEGNETVAAYSHIELGPERKRALQWLADKIDELTAPRLVPAPQATQVSRTAASAGGRGQS